MKLVAMSAILRTQHYVENNLTFYSFEDLFPHLQAERSNRSLSLEALAAKEDVALGRRSKRVGNRRAAGEGEEGEDEEYERTGRKRGAGGGGGRGGGGGDKGRGRRWMGEARGKGKRGREGRATGHRRLGRSASTWHRRTGTY